MRLASALALSIAVTACAAQPPSPSVPLPHAPALIPPIASTSKESAVVLVPPPPFPEGCTVVAKAVPLVVRARPELPPLFRLESHRVELLLAKDGSMITTLDAFGGALRVRAYVAPDEVELGATGAARFGSMIERHARLHWDGFDGDAVRLGFDLPSGITLDDSIRVQGAVACGNVALVDPLPDFARGAFAGHVDGGLAQSPGGRPRLLGLHAPAMVLERRGEFVRVAVAFDRGLARGWTKKDAYRENSGIGLGWIGHIGHVETLGFTPPEGSIACPAPLPVELPIDGSRRFAIGTYAAGAPFVIVRAGAARDVDGEDLSRVELGPEGDPHRDAGWLVPSRKLIGCSADDIQHEASWRF